MVKTSKELIIDYFKKEKAKGNGDIDTTRVSEALNILRSNTSALLNQLVAEGKLTKTNTRPVYYSLPQELSDFDAFTKIVGHDKSLSNVVQLAKAAIHYPAKSLNTLIVGDSGTGKSHLALIMFEYAKKIGKVSHDAEFYKVNCRHFVNNPKELGESLFGNSDNLGTINLFDAAENSILFIDNIDLLDGSSLAKINAYLDTGVYTYLNGTSTHEKNVTLVIAINRKANPEILQSLYSKISVHIEMPELKQRPLEERLELINNFFIDEAMNTKHNIQIEPDVLKALLIVDSPLNIKYLYGVIKVAVANAYLRCYDQKTETIQVVISDFEREVSNSLLNYKSKQNDVEKVIASTFDYLYLKDGKQQNTDVMGRYFYNYLNKKLEDLHSKKLDKKKIDEIISSEINMLVSSFKQEIRHAELNINQLSKVVDPEIIKLVTEFISECSRTLNVNYPNSVVYGLCLHVNAISKNTRGTKYLNKDKVNEVITNYAKEYELAQILVKKIEKIIEKKLSTDEIIMITMFLIVDEEKENGSYPQVLVAMHGDSTASSISNVVNELVKINNTFSYDMSLQKNSENAYLELKKLISEIDQGSGVIVIYDMGSLKTILDRISLELESEIRLVYMPITLIGIEASRKASMNTDIDAVYHNIVSSLNKEVNVETFLNKVAIITLCHTGDGGAQEMKEYIQERFTKDIKIYALAISDRKQLVKEVQKISRYYEIRAFVGTYDPKLFGIPFIPVSKLFDTNTENIERLLLSNTDPNEVDFVQLIEYLSTESGIDIEKLKKTIPKIIEELDEEYDLNIDQQVGLFLHIGALINRLINNIPLPKKEVSADIDLRSSEIKFIKELLKKIERTFKIIVPDSELATIYEIIRKEGE